MQSDYSITASARTLSPEVNKVLRNTYMLLGLTMLPTVAGALLGLNMNLSFMMQNPLMSFIISLAIMFGLFMGISANKNSSVGVVLLLALTGFMGVILGPILQVALSLSNGPQLIGMAAGGTGIIFMSLASYAAVSKRNFSFLGNFLFIGLILLIIASVANIFLQIPILALTISSVGILLFSGFILYDVNRIVLGGETNYVMATLALYLDIYNLFVNLLHFLMMLLGERD